MTTNFSARARVAGVVVVVLFVDPARHVSRSVISARARPRQTEVLTHSRVVAVVQQRVVETETAFRIPVILGRFLTMV